MPYIRFEYPKFSALTNDGLLAVGWKLNTYLAGTSFEAVTYYEKDLAGGHANTNPVVLNARGEASIFSSRPLKLVLKTDTDVQIWEQDYVGDQSPTVYTGFSSGTSGNVYNITVDPAPTVYSGNMTVVFTPDVTNTDTIGTLTYSSYGPNDCRVFGPYLGDTSSTFQIQIESVDYPNTFRWRKDAGEWVTGISITGEPQTLIEGLTVKFSTLTGHILYSYWIQSVIPPAKVNINGLGEILVYKNQGGNMVGIDGGDIVADYPATLTYSDIQNCAILNNPATEVFDSTANIGFRDRIEKGDNYTLSTSDRGKIIDMNCGATRTLTLGPASEYNGMFFYIRAAWQEIYIAANGSEVIWGKYSTPGVGINPYYLQGFGSTVQIQSNGVSWEVITEENKPPTKQIILNNTSYSPPNGCRTVEVEVIGGGSGGNPYVEGASEGQAGYGGGYASSFFYNVQLWGPVPITIGEGGAAGYYDTTMINGTPGGTTSFGEAITATGGSISVGGIGYGPGINLGAYGPGPPKYDGYGYRGSGGNAGDPGFAGVCIITEYY